MLCSQLIGRMQLPVEIHGRIRKFLDSADPVLEQGGNRAQIGPIGGVAAGNLKERHRQFGEARIIRQLDVLSIQPLQFFRIELRGRATHRLERKPFDVGPRGFVGHIGGDDFIFIIPASEISLVCTEILSVFDTLVPYQYNEQDRRAGYYFGKDRRGQLHRVPLMTLSVGIVTNRHRSFAHPAEVSELATEMKSYAKTLPGSVFVVDRRQTRSDEK